MEKKGETIKREQNIPVAEKEIITLESSDSFETAELMFGNEKIEMIKGCKWFRN